MGRKKGSGLFTGIVTVALAGVVALGAYKWDNLKPALLETKIYSQAEYDKQSSQIDQYKDMVQEQQTTIQDQQTTIDEQNELLNTKYYVATFISDGIVLENQILASGSIIEYTGETPTKENHNFLGWSVDNENIIEDLSTLQLNNHLTIYAVFEEILPETVFNNMTLTELIEGGYLQVSSSVLSPTETFSTLPAGELVFTSDITDIKYIENFKNLTNITKVEIKESSIVGIKDDCFSCCENLKEVIMPNTINYLGYRSFLSCTSLEKINLSTSLTKLNSHTFSGCTSLTSLYIPASVVKIDLYSWGEGIIAGGTPPENCVIYCEAESKPSAWSDYWNCRSSESDKYEVVWGVTYDQYLEAIGG